MSVGVSPSLPGDLFLVFVASVDLQPRVSLGYVFFSGALKGGKDHEVEKTVLRCWLRPCSSGNVLLGR